MILLIAGLGLLTFGIVYRIRWQSRYGLNPYLMFAVVILFVTLMLFLGWRFTATTLPEERRALLYTITAARQDDNHFEEATITAEIVEFNKIVALAKMWNKTIWGLYIPDSVEDIEFIE